MSGSFQPHPETFYCFIVLMFSFIITDDKKKVEFHQDCLLSFFSSHWKNVATA